MNVLERIGLIAGLWVFLAALINAIDAHWLASGVCLCLVAAMFAWLFGRANDRAWDRKEREQSALLAQLEADTRAETRGPRYERNEEGFYVRVDDVGTDL